MRAVTYHRYGDPSVLTVEDVPEPHAGPGQIRIRVAAAGVNPIDWKLRAGYLHGMFAVQFPKVPGRDAAGVVDEIGEGVTGITVGDRVFGNSSEGTTAEYALLYEWARVPDAWTMEQAAAVPVAAETAIRVLNQLGVRAGSTLLVEGAAGGVGSTAVQIAVARGAAVIGTASEGNHEFLRSLGAIATTYGPGLADRVRVLAPAGVDAVLDVAGAGSLPDLVKIAHSATDVVSIADPTAPEHGARLSTSPDDPTPDSLVEAAALGAAGSYVPYVEASYALDQIAEAHARSQAGHVRGKLIIRL